MKKTLASILALSLVVSSFPLSVYAEAEVPVQETDAVEEAETEESNAEEAVTEADNENSDTEETVDTDTEHGDDTAPDDAADTLSDTAALYEEAIRNAAEYMVMYDHYIESGIPERNDTAANVADVIERFEIRRRIIRNLEDPEKEIPTDDYVEITDDNMRRSIMETARRCLTPEQYAEMTAEDGVYRLYYFNEYPIYVRDDVIEGLEGMDVNEQNSVIVPCADYIFKRLDNLFMAINIRNSQLQEIEDIMTELGHWNIVDDVFDIKESIKNKPYSVINAGSGSDTYNLDPECGYVLIRDYTQNNSGDADKLVFNYEVSADDVLLWRNGNDLIIIDEEHGNYVCIIDYFSDCGNDLSRIEIIEFSDGTTLSYEEVCAVTNICIGTDEDDVLESYADSSLVLGLSGNDTIVSHDGDNIVFGGDGDDVIQGYFGKDYLFGGDGNDIITGCGFIFSGGDTDIMIGGKGDDILKGKGYNDIYIYYLGDGNDIVDESDGDGYDILALGEGIEPDEVFVFMTDNRYTVNLLIEKTGEVISMPGRVVSDYAPVSFPIEEVRFADGTVWKGSDLAECANIIGTDGDDRIDDSGESDILWCGRGNDLLIGRSGDDTYIYDYGDGYDLIFDNTIWGSPNDVLRFADGISPDEIYAENRGRYYYLYVRDMSGCVAVYGIETVVFGDGTEWSEGSILENAHPASELCTDIKGDVNSDGIVNAADLTMMKKYLSEETEVYKALKEKIELPNFSAADIDEDGRISIADYIYLKSILLEA